MIIHVVQPGETIYSIADSYGLSAERLIQDNELTNPNNLVVGQTIVIVYPEQTYTVQEGDTLESIADANGVTQIQLLRNNPGLSDSNILYPGETIVINYDVEKIRSISVNGYAYPFIDLNTLRKTLPYLTYLTIFTYGFTPEGELIQIDDTEVIQTAKDYGVAPIMLISTFKNDGTSYNELAHSILMNEESQNRLIDNIIANMKAKGYYGLTVDFGFILEEDKQAYVDFIAKVTNRLNQEGYEAAVSLNTTGNIEVYEGHDYSGLGSAANDVLFLRYEFGYAFGPPMPAAPNNKVRELIEYAVTQMPPEKITFGVQKYGYDWALPYVAGVTKAESLGNAAAVELASEVGTTIQFDEVAKAPFFQYEDISSGVPIQHIVWFDDARSINEKVKFVPEYGLQGIIIWNIMRYFPQMWLVVNNQYEIEKVL